VAEVRQERPGPKVQGLRGSRGVQGLYGTAAVVGLLGTGWFNLRHASTGPTQGYLQGWFATAASSSAALDLIVVSVALSVFMVVEGRRLGMRRPWLYVVGGFVLAMAFSVPLFLLIRQRALDLGPDQGRDLDPSRRPGGTTRR
jgi:hypothetical protein